MRPVTFYLALSVASFGFAATHLAAQPPVRSVGSTSAAKPARAPRIPAAELTPQGGVIGTTPVASPGDGKDKTFRTVIHTEAYKKREHLGPHVNIKVTPPEKRGAKGRVLVEVYNYSKTYLSVADFYLILTSKIGERVEVNIDVDDIKPNWSALKWVKIPGGKIPKITRVEIQALQTFDDKGRKVKIPYYTDLIKE